MSQQDTQTEFGRLRLSATFWAVAFGLIPLVLDFVLGTAGALASQDMATGASGNATANVIIFLAWPPLAALSVFAVMRLGWLRTIGGKAKYTFWNGLGLTIAGCVIWSVVVAPIIWTLFPGAD